MASAFRQFNEVLNKQRWSLRFWDGRPTGFLPATDAENLLLLALEENDVSALNVLIDEVANGQVGEGETIEGVRADFMTEVAETIANYSYPESLEWYVTTSYPPLLASFTPDLFLDSADLQDALASYPRNVYILQRWWQTTPGGKEAIAVLSDLFLPGTLGAVAPGALPSSLEPWRRNKKARFLTDRAAQGYDIPPTTVAASSTGSASSSSIPAKGVILPPRPPQRQPRQLPPRQGSSSSSPPMRM